MTYQEYIQQTRELIRTTRVDFASKSPEDIAKTINANAPNESSPPTPANHGILLIHGLTSSPMGMSSLFDYFSHRNYLVRSLLLPGHGTHPKDLLNVKYQDWLEACRFGIETLRKEVEHVSVITFSAGSALAIYLSLTEASIDSLVLLAPALSLKHPFSSYYIPLFYPLRNCFAKINWPIVKEEDDYAKYQSIPINAIYQVTRLMKAIGKINHPLTPPLYIASTIDDETISHREAINFFLKQPNPLNRGIIYSTHPPKTLLSSRFTQRSSYYPQEKILDFSHTCLAVSPLHPHYGKKGDFTDFTHYHPRKKQEHSHHSLIHHGSISKKNLSNHHMRRLSYNPDFDYMAADIDKFLQACFHSDI